MTPNLTTIKNVARESPAILYQFERVCFTIDQTKILKNITFSIYTGEILGIIGRSGAGKSSLLGCLNGLTHITSGKLFFENTDVARITTADWRLLRAHIGMIFQNFCLLGSRNIIDNISLPLKFSGIGKAGRDKKAKELLDIVGLKDFANAYPHQLSGGQKQRVAIARALINSPKILLSDEATSALDPETTCSILELLKDINKNLGLTIVLITHEMEVLQNIAQRVIVFNEGELVEQGSTKDIFCAPQHDATIAMLKIVTPQLPEHYKQRLSPQGDYAVVEVNLAGAAATSPFLSDIEKLTLHPAFILHGGIDNIGLDAAARLFLAIDAHDLSNLQLAINYLKRKASYYELLGYINKN